MGCKNNAVEKKTKIRSGHPPIFNKLILFNSRIKSIYKNKINKKTISKKTQENPIK